MVTIESINILLVERTEAGLTHTRACLAANPEFHVIGGCTSSEQALFFSRIYHPDLIICDMYLTGPDGLWLLDRLSRLPERPAFLLTSGLATDDILQHASACGLEYFLLKPYEPQQLLDIVGRFAAQQHRRTSQPRFHARQIHRLLIQCGFTSHLHGFHYLTTGILLAVESPALLSSLTKQLYVRIAEHHNTTAACVERDIRHAITVTCLHSSIPRLANGAMIRSLIRMLERSTAKPRRY